MDAVDPYRLGRFVAAQERGGTYERAVAELRAGAKVSHWMWFVFPQVAGLGMSATSREFAIASVAEARAYLAHPVLGPRLRECARVVAETEGRSAERIFGPVDAMKLRSSMTLFAAADPAEAGQNLFAEVLAKYFGGVPDEATLARLLRVCARQSPGRRHREMSCQAPRGRTRLGSMSWTAPQADRKLVPPVADERQMLEAWLDFHRQTLLSKCAGLTADQLRQRAAPPSGLSLLGLVRHLAEVERGWFRRRVNGEDAAFLFSSEADPDGEFDHVGTADAERDFAAYLAEIEAARRAAAGHDLNETFYHSHREVDMSVRWVYVHMIEEYARHNGHADLLRERIDGKTGSEGRPGQKAGGRPVLPCARPAVAAGTRVAGSRALVPIAAADASSGEITVTVAPPSLRPVRTSRSGIDVGSGESMPSGEITTIRAAPAARSALSADRTPPSMYRRPSIVTGGQMPGTAELAATASTRLTPDAASKTVSSPDTQSIAVSFIGVTGHSRDGSRDSITASRSGSGTVSASSANRPELRSCSVGVLAPAMYDWRSAANLSQSITAISSRDWSAGSTWRASSSSRDSPLPTCAATFAPAEVPMTTSAPVTSCPASASPASSPVIHAIPATPPPPSTSACSFAMGRNASTARQSC